MFMFVELGLFITLTQQVYMVLTYLKYMLPLLLRNLMGTGDWGVTHHGFCTSYAKHSTFLPLCFSYYNCSSNTTSLFRKGL